MLMLVFYVQIFIVFDDCIFTQFFKKTRKFKMIQVNVNTIQRSVTFFS